MISERDIIFDEVLKAEQDQIMKDVSQKSNTGQIIARIFRILARAHERHMEDVDGGTERFRITTMEIEELCGDFPWLRKFGDDSWTNFN